MYIKPLTSRCAKNKTGCVFSICPSRLALPFLPGEASGLLCSLELASGSTGRRLVSKGRERSQVFIVLAPFSLLGWVDCVEFVYLRSQLLSCSYSLPTPSLHPFWAVVNP